MKSAISATTMKNTNSKIAKAMSSSSLSNYWILESPIGPLLIAGNAEAVHTLLFPNKSVAHPLDPGWSESLTGPVAEAVRQLREYFRGDRTEFDLALDPQGTEFQRT